MSEKLKCPICGKQMVKSTPVDCYCPSCDFNCLEEELDGPLIKFAYDGLMYSQARGVLEAIIKASSSGSFEKGAFIIFPDDSGRIYVGKWNGNHRFINQDGSFFLRSGLYGCRVATRKEIEKIFPSYYTFDVYVTRRTHL